MIGRPHTFSVDHCLAFGAPCRVLKWIEGLHGSPNTSLQKVHKHSFYAETGALLTDEGEVRCSGQKPSQVVHVITPVITGSQHFACHKFNSIPGKRSMSTSLH